MGSARLGRPQRLGRDGRRAVRNRLISAMVDHALQSGVSVLTGVVTAVFRETILAMGWRAAPLGPARTHQGSSIGAFRSEEHTSELQSLMLISSAVSCLKK